LREPADIAQVAFEWGAIRDCKDSIISRLLALLALNDLEHANGSQLNTRPGYVAASWMINTSSGSPSSASVDGMKPQS
jgi:hypothetical protein